MKAKVKQESNKRPKRTASKPVKLRPETQKWVAKVKADFELDRHHEMLLELAGRAWDRSYNAAIDIAENGTTFSDRFGQERPRPSVKIEADSALLFSKILRELALDVEAPESPRPPQIRR